MWALYNKYKKEKEGDVLCEQVFYKKIREWMSYASILKMEHKKPRKNGEIEALYKQYIEKVEEKGGTPYKFSTFKNIFYNERLSIDEMVENKEKRHNKMLKSGGRTPKISNSLQKILANAVKLWYNRSALCLQHWISKQNLCHYEKKWSI